MRLIDADKLRKALNEMCRLYAIDEYDSGIADMMDEVDDLIRKQPTINPREAKKPGKFLRLPCAVGDPVYTIKGSKILENYITEIRIGQTGAQTIFLCYGDLLGRSMERIGKTVFLTREEAEAVLGNV